MAHLVTKTRRKCGWLATVPQIVYSLSYRYSIGFGDSVAQRQRRVRVYHNDTTWYVADPRDGELMFFHRWEDAVEHAVSLARILYPHRVFRSRRESLWIESDCD